MNRLTNSLTITGVLLILVLTAAALVAAPAQMNYQGRLTNTTGAPLAGTYTVQFTIYDAATAGTVEWQETQSVTSNADGLFSVQLGAVNPLTADVFAPATCYLGVKVGADPEITPRQRLTSVPYAQRVATIDSAAGGDVTGNLWVRGTRMGIGAAIQDTGWGLGTLTVNDGISNTLFSGTGIVVGNPSATSYIALGKYNDYLWMGYNYLDDKAEISTRLSDSPLYLQTNDKPVAIGYTYATPEAHLHIYGIDNVPHGKNACLAITNQATNGGTWYLRSGATGTSTGPGAFSIANTSSYRLVIDSSGNVGIGYMTPIYPLQMGNGAYCSVGGNWTNASDRNLKTDFAEIDGQEILTRLVGLPISEWRYKADTADIRHIGPTAQDFFEAFGLGGDTTTISTTDPSGIALAAIKELYKQNQDLQVQNANLQRQLEALSAKVEQLSKKK